MSFDLVFFGGTGDLTWRKLMPALFQAWRHGKLPAQGRILAVARDERTDASLAQRDYHVALSPQAGLVWIFLLRGKQPAWYLHGIYG